MYQEYCADFRTEIRHQCRTTTPCHQRRPDIAFPLLPPTSPSTLFSPDIILPNDLAIAPNAHFLDADFLVEYAGRLPSSGNTESINALRNIVCPHTAYFAPNGPSGINTLVLLPSSILGGYDTIYSCIVAAFSMPDDAVSFFSNYDERISFSEYTDEPDSFDAFHTAECPSPPTICPLDDTTPNPLMLLPASVLLDDALILGSD